MLQHFIEFTPVLIPPSLYVVLRVPIDMCIASRLSSVNNNRLQRNLEELVPCLESYSVYSVLGSMFASINNADLFLMMDRMNAQAIYLYKDRRSGLPIVQCDLPQP